MRFPFRQFPCLSLVVLGMLAASAELPSSSRRTRIERDMETLRYPVENGWLELIVPFGWELQDDEEGGAVITSEEAIGLLHVLPFARGGGTLTDPVEELYAFLEDQDIELEEDEIEELPLGETGALAICEYLADDDEEDEELVYWMIGVATAPSHLLFASYSCPAQEQEAEREIIRSILRSIRFP